MDFAEPHFAEPLRLWALPLAGALLGLLWWRAAAVRRKALATVASPAMLANLLRGHSPARRAVKTTVFATALALILLAVARPRWGATVSPRGDESEDIVFILDTSRSMTAKDVAPSRLDRAKLAIDTFVGAHNSGRLGLVAFAGQAFLQCPPTADRDIFRDTLAELDTKVIATPGTDIGSALEEGVLAFGNQKDKSRRTIILLTDGEDLAGQGVQTAKKLGAKGVVIHTVGIGGAGAQITTGNGVATSSLDEKTLRDIALAGKGEYFRLGGPGDSFATVENNLEHSVSASGEDRVPIERYTVPLVLALILLAGEALLGTRRKLPLAGLAKAAALIAVIGFSIHDARAESPEALYDLGADALKSGRFAEAEGYLKAALADCDDTLRPAALHNLAQSRARSALKSLEKHTSPVAQINALKDSLAAPTAAIDKILRASGPRGKLDDIEVMNAVLGAKAARKGVKKGLPPLRQTAAEARSALTALRRARDDFRGAHELNPADADARKNADTLDEREKALQPEIDREKSAVEETQKADQALKAKLKELMRRVKKQKGQPDSDKDDSDDDEDEDNDEQEEQDDKDSKDNPDKKNSDKPSDSDSRKKEGKPQSRMSREEAQAALESMSTDMRRKLQFGQKPDQDAIQRARESGNDR